MCIDFPGRIVQVGTDYALVDCASRQVRASTLLFSDLVVGDWVYVAAGTVVERLDEVAVQQINQEIAIAKGVAP
jgi:hydrogenase maturation factor